MPRSDLGFWRYVIMVMYSSARLSTLGGMQNGWGVIGPRIWVSGGNTDWMYVQ